MLGRLKIASVIPDSEVAIIMDDWLKGQHPTEYDVKSLFEWYTSKIKVQWNWKNLNVFRGINFDENNIDFGRWFEKGYIDLIQMGESFESWTVDTSTAGAFARHGSYPKTQGPVGIVISRKLTKDYIDVNLVVKYLHSQYIDVEDMYEQECEILTYQGCHRCSLKDDLECVFISNSKDGKTMNSFYRELDVAGWKYDKGIDVKSWAWAYCVLKNNKMYPFRDIDGASKNFRVKQNVKC